ncbi:hypothetical protein [Aliidiomarina celeris]|uniref:hypothetical protein n=1 Tax=Aliidiomarina celeris TaxID=2249428 RepID=UPI0013002BCB|nr:hypothetical protein [Aliidiomarina celeris]
MVLQSLIQTQSLHSVYQPIVDTYRSAIIGYESLIQLFQTASSSWVLELSEQHATENLTALKGAVHRLRRSRQLN